MEYFFLITANNINIQKWMTPTGNILHLEIKVWSKCALTVSCVRVCMYIYETDLLYYVWYLCYMWNILAAVHLL